MFVDYFFFVEIFDSFSRLQHRHTSAVLISHFSAGSALENEFF